MRRVAILLLLVLALPAVAAADGVTLAHAKLAARQAASAFVAPKVRAPISRWTASCKGSPVRRTCHVTYAPKHCSGTVTVSGKGGYVTIRGTTRIACRG